VSRRVPPDERAEADAPTRDTLVDRARTRSGVIERPAASPLEPNLVGQMFGAYLVQGRLGGGAMGVVYRATHIDTNRSAQLHNLPTSPRIPKGCGSGGRAARHPVRGCARVAVLVRTHARFARSVRSKQATAITHDAPVVRPIAVTADPRWPRQCHPRSSMFWSMRSRAPPLASEVSGFEHQSIAIAPTADMPFRVQSRSSVRGRRADWTLRGCGARRGGKASDSERDDTIACLHGVHIEVPP
jgi:hypothetical protein